MTEHTPGPWELQLANSGARIVVGELGNYTVICHGLGGNRANARLIAAAPDLLAALEEVTSPDFQKAYRDGLSWAIGSQAKARAMITKAKEG